MSNDHSDNRPKLPSHIAYSVKKGNGDKDHWHRVGAAWPTKEGGLFIDLNSLPVDGKLNLRLRSEVERMKAKRQSSNEQFHKQNGMEPKH